MCSCIPISEVDKMTRLGIAGFERGQVYSGEGMDEININVWSVPRGTELADYSVFDKIYVNSLSGQSIPLKQVASVEFENIA